MEMKTVKLGKIADFANGLNFDKTAYCPGVKIIGVSDFKDYTSPVFESLSEVSADVVKKNALLQKDDIVFVRSNGNKDLVGRCMIIPDINYPLLFSGFCIRCRFKPDLDINPRYFMYYFKSQFFRKLLSNTSVGANIQNLSQDRLSRTEVTMPPLSVQNRIASILSVYDDMTDNCKRQIALLEEAAQRLYREWFIDMRFPGYETTPIGETGLPQDWELTSVGAECDIVTGKKDANFGGKDGLFPFFTCAQEPIRANSYSFDRQAIILAGNGDFNVKVYRGKFEAYQRTYVISPHIEANFWLTYFAIKTSMNTLAVGASGSTIKFLTKGMIENIHFQTPPLDVLSSFNTICASYYTQIENVKSRLAKSIESRQILLPRLISGQIEIE